ncbi:hypothetical protein [Pseudomonas chlororaphis]|uniref:Uncharacterized protein n=1 Tax=Pseudomonas chlororaphis TaxID=587753 RepID=A0A0D5Y1P6_9PSED|nr:hypothetical protein [Pseudomonas chlororaphis]AKA24899.1 hypothetical protein PCL1606_34480 [Pseudomonas chlororaphis]
MKPEQLQSENVMRDVLLLLFFQGQAGAVGAPSRGARGVLAVSVQPVE